MLREKIERCRGDIKYGGQIGIGPTGGTCSITKKTVYTGDTYQVDVTVKWSLSTPLNVYLRGRLHRKNGITRHIWSNVAGERYVDSAVFTLDEGEDLTTTVTLSGDIIESADGKGHGDYELCVQLLNTSGTKLDELCCPNAVSWEVKSEYKEIDKIDNDIVI